MRTSSCRLTNGDFTGVLVIEEGDPPMTPDELVAAAHQSEAFVSEEHDDGYFVVRFPGGENRDVSEVVLRAYADEMKTT